MEKLIEISGYVENKDDLVRIHADEGTYYNILYPTLATYRKTSQIEIGDLLTTTDILGWFETKAELESYVTKPNQGDVYVTGTEAPYTRWKASVGTESTWYEDGQSEYKIVKKYPYEKTLLNCNYTPDPEECYAIGRNAPFELYGAKPSWERVGLVISHCGKDFQRNYNFGFKIGELGFEDGLFYLYTKKGWINLKIIEPFTNYMKHIFRDKFKTERLYAIREGVKLGTLEFYEPKES